jgi:hypothetical protein
MSIEMGLFVRLSVTHLLCNTSKTICPNEIKENQPERIFPAEGKRALKISVYLYTEDFEAAFTSRL